jgi:hypothetical protein
MKEPFGPEEERALRRQIEEGNHPRCPRCAGALRLTPILPPPQVAYVRDRVVLECDRCGMGTVIDQKRMGRLR